MSQHDRDNSSQKPGHDPKLVDAPKAFESTDVNVSGVMIAMIAFGLFATISGGIAYVAGKHMNTSMARNDGPPNKWARPVDVRPLGNMANNPDLLDKMNATIEQFPTPRTQTDDGMQDLANLHTREDLLLNNYTWIDQAQGKVRIPIARAMELVARDGLPVAPRQNSEPLLTGDTKPEAPIPLTNGFARTGYEADEARATTTVPAMSKK
jgi:hypothetical protein